MWTDILIVVLVAVTQLVITWYGVHISVPEHRARNGLVIGIIGVIGVCIAGWGAYRSIQGQEKLQAQLDKIQHNTETPPLPPVVNVTVPPTSPPPAHTHVAYLAIPDAAQKSNSPMYMAVKEGEKPTAPVAFTNVGAYAVEEPADACAIVLTPPKNIDAALLKARREMKISPASGAIPANWNLGGYHTATGPTITADDVKKFVAGDLDVCVFGAVRWKDATGRYETHFAQCLEIESDRTHANWHSPKENNLEVALKY